MGIATFWYLFMFCSNLEISYILDMRNRRNESIWFSVGKDLSLSQLVASQWSGVAGGWNNWQFPASSCLCTGFYCDHEGWILALRLESVVVFQQHKAGFHAYAGKSKMRRCPANDQWRNHAIHRWQRGCYRLLESVQVRFGWKIMVCEAFSGWIYAAYGLLLPSF